MTASLVTLAALILTAPQTQKAGDPARAQPAPPRPPTVIPVGPMPLPAPLLKYELWLAQTDAGDALPLYLAAMRATRRMTPPQAKEYNTALDVLSEKKPSAATPEDLALVRKVLEPAAQSMRLAARAARVRQCDWSPLVPPPPGSLQANSTAVLECVQGFRELTHQFRARAYLARAAGDHAAAVADAGVTLGMARHVNMGETAIHSLVATALAAIAVGQVRDVGADGGPNLLPAVLELPRPLIPFAAATRRELETLVSVYPPLDKVAGKLSADEARRLVADTHAKLLAAATPDGGATPPPGLAGADAALGALVRGLTGLARPDTGPVTKRLADLGYPPERTAGMSADQLFLLDATATLRREADATRLTAALPDGHPLLAALPGPAAPPPPKKFAPGTRFDMPAGEHPAQVGLILLRLATPALAKTRAAQAGLDFDVAALAFAEALRAELAKPGAAWGPALLDAPLVRAGRDATAFPVKWEPDGKRFRATGGNFRDYVWVPQP